MNFLDIDICCDPAFTSIWELVGTVVRIIWIGIPIVVIILGMVDLGKAVIASKEDEIKKATKSFGKRFLYAVGIFLVVWIVSLVFTLMTEIFDNTGYNESSWMKCWNVIVNGKESCNGSASGNTTNNGATGGSSGGSTGGNSGGMNPNSPGSKNPSHAQLN